MANPMRRKIREFIAKAMYSQKLSVARRIEAITPGKTKVAIGQPSRHSSDARRWIAASKMSGGKKKED